MSRDYNYGMAAYQHLAKLHGLRFEMKTKRWVERYDDVKVHKFKLLGHAYFAYMETEFLYREPHEFLEEWSYRWDPTDSKYPSKTRWICYAPGNPKEPFFKLRAFGVIDNQFARVFFRGDLTVADQETRLKPGAYERYAGATSMDRPLGSHRTYLEQDCFGSRLTSFAAGADCFSAPYGPVLTLEKYRVSLREWGITLSEKDINFSGYDCIEFVGIVI